MVIPHEAPAPQDRASGNGVVATAAATIRECVLSRRGVGGIAAGFGNVIAFYLFSAALDERKLAKKGKMVL